MTEALLRKLIRELAEEELEEVTTTSATPGVLIPGAFRGNSSMDKAKERKNAEQAGYTIVKRSGED